MKLIPVHRSIKDKSLLDMVTYIYHLIDDSIVMWNTVKRNDGIFTEMRAKEARWSVLRVRLYFMDANGLN